MDGVSLLLFFFMYIHYAFHFLLQNDVILRYDSQQVVLWGILCTDWGLRLGGFTEISMIFCLFKCNLM